MSDDASFENNLKQLEQLVAKLERGEPPLDEALQAFDQGMKLVESCRAQLAQAEVKVEKVLAAHAAGGADEADGGGDGD